MQSIFYVMYLIPFTYGAPKDTTYPERQETSHARWPAYIRRWAYGHDLRALAIQKEVFFTYESRWLYEAFDQNARPYWRFDELARDSCRRLLKEIRQTLWQGINVSDGEIRWLPKHTAPDAVIAVMDQLFGKQSALHCCFVVLTCCTVKHPAWFPEFSGSVYQRE
jgi:hypothetical protein